MRIRKIFLVIVLLYAFSACFGDGGNETTRALKKELIAGDYYIYNVFNFKDVDLLIIREHKQKLAKGYVFLVLASVSDDKVFCYKKTGVTGVPFRPVYFYTENAFLINFARNLYVFNYRDKTIKNRECSYVGNVYLKDNVIHAEAPMGLGVKYNLETLELIEKYEFSPQYRIPDVFSSIEDMALSPASLEEKGDKIRHYEKLFKIPFIGERKK